MADKKVRSLAERKQAMLEELAQLEAKELGKYKVELEAKAARVLKLEELITKYSEERRTVQARIVELREKISELSNPVTEEDGDDAEQPALSVVNA